MMKWKIDRLILLPIFLFLLLFLSGDSFSSLMQGKLQGEEKMKELEDGFVLHVVRRKGIL